MNQLLSSSLLVLVFGLTLVLIAICAVIDWTIRLSYRILKQDAPPKKTRFFIAICQVMLGILVVWLLKGINADPVLDLGVGLGLALLSGLPLMKFILKKDWRSSLLAWALAAAMQVFLVPLAAAAMLAVLIPVVSLLFPPQY